MKQNPMPSPTDVAYIEAGIHDFIMDVLRERAVNYNSPHADFIRNEVIKEIRQRICSSIKPK
ncbi:MAG: hypothetical protein [Bacteriophage sp.]|nr:MAG: hypothetical protein [Bacteriophage sp.]